MDYIWEIGQRKLVVPNGMTEKVAGTIANIKEAKHSDAKFLYVEYIDPRDGTKYGGWFNDQTDHPATAYEMNNL